MHIEFLVEELSAEATLRILVPKIVGQATTFDIHAFQGKPDLLAKLPTRLRGYRSWLPADWNIVVLIDQDQGTQGCIALKATLEQTASDAGLVTRSAAAGGTYQVLNRLAIEELEAWFLGDVEALVATYPRVSPHLGKQAKFRDPDAITGGTCEALERVLQKAGYYPAGMPKVEVARAVAVNMDPDRNRSRSFLVFRDGLRQLGIDTVAPRSQD
jgi:hypothetical protein